MKKIILSTLLLTSILCGSNKSCDLDQVIINSDLNTLQALSPEAQLNTNAHARTADLAQEIINKRQSDLKLFQSGKYRGYESPKDESSSRSIIEMTCVSSFSTLVISAISLPLLLLYNEWFKLPPTLLEKSVTPCLVTAGASYIIFITSFFGVFIKAAIESKRKKDKICRELKLRYNNAIQIKNLLLKQLANNENQTVSLKL